MNKNLLFFSASSLVPFSSAFLFYFISCNSKRSNSSILFPCFALTFAFHFYSLLCLLFSYGILYYALDLNRYCCRFVTCMHCISLCFTPFTQTYVYVNVLFFGQTFSGNANRALKQNKTKQKFEKKKTDKISRSRRTVDITWIWYTYVYNVQCL